MDLVRRGPSSGDAGVDVEFGVVDELAGTAVLLLEGALVAKTVGPVVDALVLVAV